jgi:hypothetical protein
MLEVVEGYRVAPTVTPHVVPEAIPDSENVAEYGAGGAPNEPISAITVFQF